MVNTSQRSPIWILFILFGFAAMVLFEIIRLYLGYVGNLGERVSLLSSLIHISYYINESRFQS